MTVAETQALTGAEAAALDRYWRAANYLSAGQIYLMDNPLLARIPEDQLDALLRGYGYEPVYVTGREPPAMHQLMAAALDQSIAAIRAIQQRARGNGVPDGSRPR